MASMDMDGVTRSAPEILPRVAPGNPLLLQLRSDRRLGHEWDDWDGRPLPNGGVYGESAWLFFALAAIAGSVMAVTLACGVWLAGPRLATLWPLLPDLLIGLVAAVAGFWLVWLAAVGVVYVTARNWLPPLLAEGGLLPLVMPTLERVAMRVGVSRDRAGNSMLRVFNRLSGARSRAAIDPRDLLILLPRCLGKEAMQLAMGISSRYGVSLFVASRGRHARQMIAEKRPRAVVAVACERDLVSGVHDVAGRLPVLGTTLELGDGPCRNTAFRAADLEAQVRRMLGLDEEKALTVR